MNDAAAIRAARMAWNAAIAAGDVDGAVGPVAIDAVLIPAGGAPLVGRPAIRRAWRSLMTGSAPRAFIRTPRTIDLTADGESAAEQGRWTGDGVTGRYLAEWRRTATGWVCTRELYVEASINDAAS